MDISDNTIKRNTASTIHLLNIYIDALIENIDKETLPKKINIIFDSGAVNGLLGIGAALYINKLEHKNLLKVNKISGCSIGSLIAVWYRCGCPETIYNYMDKLFAYYKIHQDFYIFESIVQDTIQLLFLDDNMEKINGNIYINYYDTLEHKPVIISHFTSRQHLIETILRSSHVPFMTTNALKNAGRYIDGIVPYVFHAEEQCQNVLIKLISFTSPLECLKTKNEQNIFTRLLRGLAGANNFFVNGDTDICCYINRGILLEFFLREYFVLFIIGIIDILIFLRKKLPPSLCECFWGKVVGRFAMRCWLYTLTIVMDKW
jgi:hypothetical protein